MGKPHPYMFGSYNVITSVHDTTIYVIYGQACDGPISQTVDNLTSTYQHIIQFFKTLNSLISRSRRSSSQSIERLLYPTADTETAAMIDPDPLQPRGNLIQHAVRTSGATAAAAEATAKSCSLSSSPKSISPPSSS